MSKEQWLKILKGFGIAMAGAALTFAATVVVPALQESDSATLLAVAAFASTAVNLARKWLESLGDKDAGDFTPMMLAGLALLLVPGISHAQMVEYGGKMYSGRVCSNPRCTMCDIIESQLAAARLTNAFVPVTKEIASSSQYRTETRTRTVTKYRQVCTFNRFGVKTGCQMVPYQAEETYTVQVPVSGNALASGRSTQEPVASATPLTEDWGPTPSDAVPYLIGLLGMESTSRFIDIGAGDGRLVVAALKAGVRDAVGIEINKQLADKAHVNAWPLGGSVYRGDALDTNLYADRTHAALYQFPDLAADVVKLLEPGTVVVSYSHDVPGLDTERFSFGDHEFYRGVVPAPITLAPIEVKPVYSIIEEPAPLPAPLFGLSLRD